jgi:hypothetical protein
VESGGRRGLTTEDMREPEKSGRLLKFKNSRIREFERRINARNLGNYGDSSGGFE